MRPLFLVTVSVLSLLCTACASHRVAVRPVKAGAADVKAGGTGAEIHPGDLFGIVSTDSGTATDKHSDVASKTPDGGNSAATVTAPKPPTEAPSVPEGADGASADLAKALMDKAAADAAAKAATDARSKDNIGDGPGSELAPTDGSDPSVGRPAAPSRKRT
jgi:hypothetical protein